MELRDVISVMMQQQARRAGLVLTTLRAIGQMLVLVASAFAISRARYVDPLLGKHAAGCARGCRGSRSVSYIARISSTA